MTPPACDKNVEPTVVEPSLTVKVTVPPPGAATPPFSTLSLHDALPISPKVPLALSAEVEVSRLATVSVAAGVWPSLLEPLKLAVCANEARKVGRADV